MSRRRASVALAVVLAVAALLGVAGRRRTVARGRAEAGTIAARLIARAVVEPEGGVVRVRATMPGVVRELRARAGDRVSDGDALCVIQPREPGDLPSTVRSTVTGVVLARHVEPGDVLGDAPGYVLFELADVTRLRVRIEAEAADATGLAQGRSVTFTAPGGGEVLARGTLEGLGASLERRAIGEGDPRLRADGRVRAAWVALPDGGAGLLVGQELDATIALPERHVAVRVPRAAVEVRGGWATVRTSGGLIERELRVTLGASDERYVEVIGVAPGTPVALR